MPRLRLDDFDDSHDGPRVLLPQHLSAEMHRIAGTVAAPAAGVDITLAVHPVVTFEADTEAAAYSAAGEWCRDHLGNVSAVIASWMRFNDEEGIYQLGLVLEA